MTIGPEPMRRIFFRSVRFGIVGVPSAQTPNSVWTNLRLTRFEVTLYLPADLGMACPRGTRTRQNSMNDATTPVADLKSAIRAFAAARAWEPYHSPKNLAMALASEVGELCEVFRWLTDLESRQAAQDAGLRERIADELADVTNIALLMSSHTGIDLSEAVRRKLAQNAIKYPAPPG